MSTQWTCRGAACFGVSVHVVPSDERDAVLRTDADRTRHHYRWGTVRRVLAAGFDLLPTSPTRTTTPCSWSPTLSPGPMTSWPRLPHREENPYDLGGTGR